MSQKTNLYIPIGEIEKTFVNSIWFLEDKDISHSREVILPKGTVEIIFNFSDNILYINPANQASIHLPAVFINGLNFKPFELRKSGPIKLFGIQLNNIGLRMLFNLSVKEFNNKVFEAKIICSEIESLGSELSCSKNFDQGVEIILMWIRKKAIQRMNNFAIERASRLICLEEFEDMTVKKLCSLICLSERQLRRFSLDWLGMNTEEFISYKKYLKSLSLLHFSDQKLTDVGLQAGYYDQSHFIHEFKSFTDMTPKEYRHASKGIPGHIFCKI